MKTVTNYEIHNKLNGTLIYIGDGLSSTLDEAAKLLKANDNIEIAIKKHAYDKEDDFDCDLPAYLCDTCQYMNCDARGKR